MTENELEKILAENKRLDEQLKEIELEKAKAEKGKMEATLKADQDAKEAKALEEMKAKITQEVKENLGIKAESKIENDEGTQKTNLEPGNQKLEFAGFLDVWANNHGVDPTKKYEDWTHDYCNRFGYKERR